MAIGVPFYSQRGFRPNGGTPRPPGGAEWSDRVCAIACVTMVVNHYGHDATMADVLARALERDAFDPGRGWLQGPLVEVLQSFGLAAYRRNWLLLDRHEADYLAGRKRTPAAHSEMALVRREMIAEGVWTIRRLLGVEIPVIVSTYRPRGDRSRAGHQLVLVAVEDDTVTYHDPADEMGAFVRRPLHELVDNWKGTAVIAHPWEAGVNPSTG
jgi:hypothetical protein